MFKVQDKVKAAGDYTPRGGRVGTILAARNGVFTVRFPDGVVNLYFATEIVAA